MSDTGTQPPRIYISVTDGVATVEAVDGTVEVVLVDFDREGSEAMTQAEIDSTFSPCAESGNAEDFDRVVADGKQHFASNFGKTLDWP